MDMMMGEADAVRVLENRRILVLEDEYFLADNIVSLIKEAGGAVEGPYADVAEAMAAVRSNGFDLAVIDINLRGRMAYAVAAALQKAGIPFVFATGYSGAVIPEAWRHIPRCEKPYQAEDLLAKLATLARSSLRRQGDALK